MADNNLPPLNEDATEETILSRSDSTRPHARARQEDTEENIKHRTEMLKKAPSVPPSSQHVQAVRGNPNPTRQSPPSGYVPRRRSKQRTTPENSALYLPWWSIILMLIGVMLVSIGIVGGIFLFGESGSRLLAEPSPIILIVTADQSAIGNNASAQTIQQAPSTEIINGQNAPNSLELAGPTLAPVQISPTPAAIRIGSVVIVDGVDLNTLNVRNIASLTDSSILFRAAEAEIFNIVDGPAQSDGFTWWQIQDPNDVNRIGWAVSNFLTVQAP
ncbi:MAG: hypothetical protein WBC91_04795 [Phototrophicaceae bacterium]